jgi:hypothetical protein
MIMKESLTNEKLSGKFRSQFDLVNYSIKLAENMIKTGREGRGRRFTQNRSCQILEEIVEGVDKFDDVSEYRSLHEPRENDRHSRDHGGMKFHDEGHSRPVEKKKARLARIEVASED